MEESESTLETAATGWGPESLLDPAGLSAGPQVEDHPAFLHFELRSSKRLATRGGIVGASLEAKTLAISENIFFICSAKAFGES